MYTPTAFRLHALAWAVTAALCAPSALAQQAPPSTASAGNNNPIDLDAVVVTGTATAKSKLKSSVSVSTIGAEAIEQSSPRTTADIFRNIPGIRSEATGGEGNANIAVRGLPVASGGAKFLQLQEDGLPVLEFGDIAFANADIFLRADYTLERVEAVRGGSASTFASNSPGGIINFISKTGETKGGSVGITRGLGNYDSTRLDFDYGAPVGEHWQYNVGGFYRRGDGLRNAGYTTDKGGQIKGNVTRLFDNGYLRLYFKYLNDRAAAYLPVPTGVSGSDGSPSFSSVDGFDAATDTLYSKYIQTLRTLNGDNQYSSVSLGDGMHPVSKVGGLEAKFDLGNGWTVLDKLRVADTSGRFVGLFPASVSDASSMASSIGGSGATLVYADGSNAGQTYTGKAVNSILFNVYLNDLSNTVNDLSFDRDFQLGNGSVLNVKVGDYLSRQNIDMDWAMNSYLQTLSRNSRLLNVVSASGTVLSQDGLYAYGQPSWSNCCTRSYDVHYDIHAPYAALSWDNGPLSVDASLRYDMGRARGSYAGATTLSNDDVDGDGVIEATEASVAVIDDASRKPVDYDWNYLSYSTGFNYLINDDLAGFGRISRGARANADRLLFGIIDDNGNVSSAQAVNFVNQIEGGLKWRHGGLSLFATAFGAQTQEQNYEATTQRFLDRTYRAYGTELEAAYRVGGFALNGGLTWTHARITKDEITPGNVGNTPRRQADIVGQLTASYGTERYQFGVNLIGTTWSYTQDSNQLTMPGYVQTNLFASYRISDALSLSLNFNNLFNTFGLTEAEESSLSGLDLIRARALTARTGTATVRYDF
jgi:outer membrane receptor protein involved in Fe transport